MIFYLGTDRPNWLGWPDMPPLFVSRRVLDGRRTLPRAQGRWALDSGAFTELTMHGRWTVTAAEYAATVRRMADEVGNLDFASQQDAMCEPWVLEKAAGWLGGTVEAHQRWTVTNLLELRSLEPDLPIIPVLQGWGRDDYMRHVDAFAAAGIDLPAEPRVGLGSVCRRQATDDIAAIVHELSDLGLRLHGFGVKTAGFPLYGHRLASADSMAWCYRGWRNGPCKVRGVKNCAHCLHFALEWRERALTALANPTPFAPQFDFGPTGPLQPAFGGTG